MGVLNWITQGCDALTATASPSIDALGVRMCIALATIMLVWFGVQESLASAHGGPGFNMGKFLSFFMLITFAYTMVQVLRQQHSRRWLFAPRIYQRRCAVPCLDHWKRQRNEYPEHAESGAGNERSGHSEGVDESLLRHRLRHYSSA